VIYGGMLSVGNASVAGLFHPAILLTINQFKPMEYVIIFGTGLMIALYVLILGRCLRNA